jgi:UDP-glucuronate decarboxylase
MNSISTVLVTGAAGFLGVHLCQKYLEAGFNVIAVDNFCTGQRKNRDFLEQNFVNRILFVESDITQEWAWLENVPSNWLKTFKYLFHFASPASPPHFQKLNLETIWANTIGLERSIIIANKYGAKVVFASTSEIYGDPLIHPQPESSWGNVNSHGDRSCYNESKRLGETLIYSYNRNQQSRHGIVRIFNTYGPGMRLDDGRVVINFVDQAIRSGKIYVYGDGLQTRSFCHVDDLIEGIVKYAEADICEPVNLGSEEEITVLALAKLIQTLVGDKKTEIIHKSIPKDDPKKRRPDTSKARSALKWQAKIPLIDGIKNMIQWVSEQTHELE